MTILNRLQNGSGEGNCKNGDEGNYKRSERNSGVIRTAILGKEQPR